MTSVAGTPEQHVLGFPGVGDAGPGHSPAGRYRAPAMGRHGKVSPGCQGSLWLCMTATLQLVFQSGQWGQGWDRGWDQDQEPDSVLLTMIN